MQGDVSAAKEMLDLKPVLYSSKCHEGWCGLQPHLTPRVELQALVPHG